ncbi:MAG: FAD-binding protein [Dysosmobacter welbionis]
MEITFDQQAADYLPDLRIEKEEPWTGTPPSASGAGPAHGFSERGEQLVLLLDMAARCGAPSPGDGQRNQPAGPGRGADRLVIDTSAGLSRVEAGGTPGTILAEAGPPWPGWRISACRQGLAGLEFAHGIPGTVGGAVCMNAGAYGGEMAQVVRRQPCCCRRRASDLTGAEMAWLPPQLDGSPGCGGAAGGVLPDARRPGGNPGPDEGAAGKAQGSQPLEFPSAGSTFKRPEGYYAGTLIDQCGLKGLDGGRRPGQREACGLCHQRGGATCADVKELIRQIQERVFAQAGVWLEPEVRIID